MKVILFNGSPHANGHTYQALQIVANTLQTYGIATEILSIGNRPVQDCIACGGCVGQGHCVFDDDCCNTWLDKAATADAFVFGTPVYYAHPSGRLLSIMDRLFYAGGTHFHHKPAAVVATARRAGCTNALDAVMKHLSFAQMPIVSSTYWPMYFGDGDAEGVQTMENLGKNLAWLLQCVTDSQKDGVNPPTPTPIVRTNFCR